MFNKGSVILTPFPFTDLSGNKVRPAVVISHRLAGDDVVVVFLTSQLKLKQSHLISIKPTQTNGLKGASKAVCSKIATLDKRIIVGEIGELSKTDTQKITKELKRILEL